MNYLTNLHTRHPFQFKKGMCISLCNTFCTLTFRMGAFSSQTRVRWSGLRRSVAHTLLSRPPEYTVVNVSLACNAHTLSSWTRRVAIHLCWPRDQSRIVPSELPDKHCKTRKSQNWNLSNLEFLLVHIFQHKIFISVYRYLINS